MNSGMCSYDLDGKIMNKFVDKFEKKDRISGQIRLLQNFYKELNGWEISSVGAWFAAGLLLVIGTPLFWIPIQDFNHSHSGMYVLSSFIICMGLFLYMQPYFCIQEFCEEKPLARKQKSIMRILRYLPVDRRSIFLFLLKKLFRMVLILGSIQLTGQCLAAGLSIGRLSVENFLFPILLGMLLPAAVNVWMMEQQIRND